MNGLLDTHFREHRRTRSRAWGPFFLGTGVPDLCPRKRVPMPTTASCLRLRKRGCLQPTHSGLYKKRSARFKVVCCLRGARGGYLFWGYIYIYIYVHDDLECLSCSLPSLAEIAHVREKLKLYGGDHLKKSIARYWGRYWGPAWSAIEALNQPPFVPAQFHGG